MFERQLLETMLSGKSIESLRKQYSGKKLPPSYRDQIVRAHANARNLFVENQDKYALRTTMSDGVATASKKALNQLQQIGINDLIIEKVHKGKVFVGRSIMLPVKMNAVSTIVQDPLDPQLVVCVSIYNLDLFTRTDPKKKMSQPQRVDAFLPVGTTFAIKEPYLKATNGGSFAIRVENPSDLVWFEPADLADETRHPHLKFPTGWRDAAKQLLPKLDNPEDCKKLGNEEYAAGRYEQALSAYNRGLQMDPQHDVLLLNKLAVLLQLDRFAAAAILSASLVKKMPTNEKAHLRAAKAFYAVGAFARALTHYETVAKLNAANRDAPVGIASCRARIKENTSGEYDLATLQSQHHAAKVDCSEYTGPVKIVMTETMGRGLVCTQDVPAGTLMLVCRAADMHYQTSNISEEKSITVDVDLNKKMFTDTGHVRVEASLCNKVVHDPFLARRLSLLYAGPAHPVSANIHVHDFDDVETAIASAAETPAATVVDVKRIKDITHYNAFDPSQQSSHRACGLWLLPSLINHSCIDNVSRSFVGDVMFVRAVRPIRKDEPLLFNYVQCFDSYEKRSKAFSKYEFSCTCRLCQLDEEDAQSKKKRPSDIMESLHERIASGDATVIPLLEQHVKELRQAYRVASDGTNMDKRNSGTRLLPLELFHPLNALGTLYERTRPIDRQLETLKTFTECAKICGHTEDIEEKSDDEYRITQPILATISVHCAVAALRCKQEALAKKWFSKAKHIAAITEGITAEMFSVKFPLLDLTQ